MNRLLFKPLLVLMIVCLAGFTTTESNAQCADGENAECHRADSKDGLVNCIGDCDGAPSCYAAFRKANSNDEWTSSGQSSMKEQQGMEHCCICHQ